ncbi:hypothetical protein [Trinickia mobilis]|uniref:hypothetical protein n=1 Tax=Trinickia mobilis TaxID=2816356 RepID=UPI001A8C7B4B|nr:hypothetical protein [Trinickia mobilis]
MKVNRVEKNAEIELGYDELLILNAALNEVCNGIDAFEFETRVGASIAQVEVLMKGIQAVLDKIENR